MTDPHDLSLIPSEARAYQGTPAGIATRVVANTVDGLVVGVALLGGYLGYLGLRLVLDPRGFESPDLSFVWVVIAFETGMAVYLTFWWWTGGRSPGKRLMGLQVTSRSGGRLGLPRSFVRAVACVVFPIGLLWCVVDPDRRSVQDLALRTSVVHNWLPRAAA